MRTPGNGGWELAALSEQIPHRPVPFQSLDVHTMPLEPAPHYDPDESVLKPLSPLAAALERASLMDIALFAIALNRSSLTPSTPATPETHRATSC